MPPAPDSAARVSRGHYRLGPATPMPLTNRLHFVGGAAASPLPDRSPSLADWDFLKASPHDLHALSDTIEMDDYCEIASVQDSLQHYLGAPVIPPGAVKRLDDYTVVIEGLGGEEVTAVRQGGSPPDPDGLPHGGDARGAVGGHGRFLAVAWYQPGMRGAGGGGGAASAPRAPELLHFEACGRDEAVLDDMIGHVRLRGRAGAGGLRARYGQEWQSIASGAACLAAGGGAAEYRRARGPRGSPEREFFAAVDDMRAAWAPCRTGDGLPAAPRDIVPEGGADAAALSSWAGRGANRTLLADMQHAHDLTGYWPGERDGDGGTGIGRGGISPRAAGLERLGLLRRDGRILSVTDRGLKALADSFRRDARQYAEGKNIVYLPEAGSRIPASVILRHLRDGGDFERAAGPCGKNSLLWVRKGAGADAGLAAELERCEALLAEHHGIILECTRTVNHDINARFVQGELEKRGARIAFFCVSAMLGQLERAGRLEAAGGGDWTYPLRGRILDTMRGNRARAWDMDGIFGATGAARNDIKSVAGALEDLAARGEIVGLEDGVWGCREDGIDGEEQRRRRAFSLAKSFALSALRGRKAGTDHTRLVETVSGHLSEKFQANQVRGMRRIVDDAVSRLVEDGRVRKGDGMLRLAASL